MSEKLSLLLILSLVSIVSGTALASQCPGTAHTVHTVSVNKAATCVLAKLYETKDFCLADGTGKNITGQPIAVVPGQNMNFQMSFGDNADFDMEYALTCVVNDSTGVQSPKVIFTIGADGPADPDISTVTLYGAQGSWQATGAGENYTLTF